MSKNLFRYNILSVSAFVGPEYLNVDGGDRRCIQITIRDIYQTLEKQPALDLANSIIENYKSEGEKDLQQTTKNV